ncbi:hypothetical protein BC941DRAFT_76097 [Chlamydoabsidia padenii]|nr:hypothetical protein BC941DRAFT_76097 [Chlamydoabsidia padenii]
MVMKLMGLVLTDFYANCIKPIYPTTNERTPYVEHVILIFKYFSAFTQLASFVWCDKGLPICVPNSTKLMDGFGLTTLDKLGRNFNQIIWRRR